MELCHLREFVVLAKHLNFSVAARNLFITQPVLSRHISELEQELNVLLFVRNKHSVQLTAVGNLLLEEAQILLARYEETLEKIRLAASGLTGCVNIGFLGAAVKPFLVPFVMHFNCVHPKIQLQFSSYENARMLTDALLRRDIDIGFTLSMELPTNSSKLNWKPIYSDTVSAVLPHNHPLANEKNIDITQLANEPFILLSPEHTPDSFEHVMEICKAGGFAPNVVRQSTRLDAVFMMIEMGLGISIMPRHTQVYANPAIRYIDLTGADCRLDVVLAWRTDCTTPAVFPFLSEFETVSSRLPGSSDTETP
ncbi:LysR substrate-binding domain-containing protein [Sporomusa aerivorans]|uniref:LysR substrate-binding domain-containing protein n=1 Tax=Sporomusa aerivorans TaxID=204936 RepID=UPI00352B8163